MNDSIYQRIDTNPRFKELVAKRERFAWILSSIMLGLYVIFILLIAFQPQLLGARISPDSSVTWGIPMGVGLILAAFILTGLYVRRANGEFDSLNQEILKEAQHDRSSPCRARPCGLRSGPLGRRADRRRAAPAAERLGHRHVRRLRRRDPLHHLLGIQAQPLGGRLLCRRRPHHRLPEWPGDRRRLHVGGILPGYFGAGLHFRLRRPDLLDRLPGRLADHPLPHRRAPAQPGKYTFADVAPTASSRSRSAPCRPAARWWWWRST